MSRAQQEMQDVVLDEVEAVDGAGTGSGAPDRARPRPVADPASTHATESDANAAPATAAAVSPVRRRLVPIAVVAALVALAAGAGIVDARREAAVLAGLADLPGALAPVDGPLRELWRASDLFGTGFDRVGALLVGAGLRPGGAVDAAGIDARTGAEVWTTPLSPDGRRTGGAACETPAAGPAEPPGRAPGSAGGDVGGVVTVCIVVDEVAVADDAAAGMTQPTASRLLVLDPATGRVLRERPTSPTTSVAALGTDLVISTLADDGRLVVRRTDPLGDQVRWDFTSPEPLEETAYGLWAWVDVVAGMVVAGGDSGWVLSADGEPLHAWEPAPRGAGWLDVLGNGLVVQPAAGEGSATRVVDPRTSASFVVDGRPLWSPLDDGSAGDVLLTQVPGDRMAAVDLATGDRLWSVPDAGTGSSGLLVVDGRVVRTHDGGLAALDAATGRTLWTTTVVPLTRYALMTDGLVVLCVVQGTSDPRPVLAAFGLEDGRRRWETALPAELDHLFVVDGGLFAYADSELVALG